jgi:hypothetical protein
VPGAEKAASVERNRGIKHKHQRPCSSWVAFGFGLRSAPISLTHSYSRVRPPHYFIAVFCFFCCQRHFPRKILPHSATVAFPIFPSNTATALPTNKDPCRSPRLTGFPVHATVGMDIEALKEQWSEVEDRDGLRLSWNVFPSSRMVRQLFRRALEWR